MEDIFELIIAIFSKAFGSHKIKTWVKTVIFLVITLGLSTLLIVLGLVVHFHYVHDDGLIAVVIGSVLAIGFSIGAVIMHRRDWV